MFNIRAIAANRRVRSFVFFWKFVLTANFWKSIGIAIVAITVPLLPFFWKMIQVYLDQPTDVHVNTMHLFAGCIDEWMVGTLSVGIAAAVNWGESKIDFRLSFFGGLLTALAVFGAGFCLAIFVVLHQRSEDLVSRFDQYSWMIGYIYKTGLGILFTSFLSIGECRRAKDLERGT